MWHYDLDPIAADDTVFLDTVIAGLCALPKTLPEELFVPVTDHYLPRAEAELLAAHAKSIARAPAIIGARDFARKSPSEARALLRSTGERVGPKGAILCAVDLKKDPAIFHRAYNTDEMARASKKTLLAVNERIGSSFDSETFHHYASYSPWLSRVELHLVSARRQKVSARDHTFVFDEGESVLMDAAHKYGEDELVTLARAAGLEVKNRFLDSGHGVALFHFAPFRPSLFLAMDA